MAMKFIKKDFERIVLERGMPDIARTVRVLKQTGNVPNLKRDQGRAAKLQGKRISASGKVYWETRRNRSDRIPSKKL